MTNRTESEERAYWEGVKDTVSGGALLIKHSLMALSRRLQKRREQKEEAARGEETETEDKNGKV